MVSQQYTARDELSRTSHYTSAMHVASASRADLADPAMLAALGHIEIVARWIVDGFLTGLHRSPRKGASAEFAEYRPYLPGDDPRYLDWKIVARADRWMVKQFEAETNLRAMLVLDASRSMAWTGAPARLTKLAYAERLVAALALLLIRQRDAVGLVRFDERLRAVVPSRARSAHWRRILAALDGAAAGNASVAADGLMHAAQLARRPGLVILISDLLVDPESLDHSVRVLRAGGHDVTVLHILDPAEVALEGSGDALFVDPESGLVVPATVADVRAAYAATVERAIAEWRERFAAAGAGYETVLTDLPFGVPLHKAFSAHQRVR